MPEPSAYGRRLSADHEWMGSAGTAEKRRRRRRRLDGGKSQHLIHAGLGRCSRKHMAAVAKACAFRVVAESWGNTGGTCEARAQCARLYTHTHTQYARLWHMPRALVLR